MGLDLVGLVMEIEETFEIQFSDEDAPQMRTVGDVFEYILAHTSVTGATCLSAATFYRLRRGAHALGVGQRVRPGDTIEVLLPARGRQRYWQKLAQTTGLRLPRLERPSWLVLLCVLVVLLSAAASGAVVYEQTRSQSVAWSFVFVVTALLGWIAVCLTRGCAIQPAAQHQTVRALTEVTLAYNFPALSAAYAGAHRQDVWLALQAIIVEQLGVPAEKVTPAASFAKDLGAS